MSDARRGLPLLSESPPTFAPPNSETACRKCNKEFNVIFARSRKCNHCGYSYCHTCSDFQALMPRSGSDGYDTMHICGFCVEFLTITAAGRNSLKALPLGKLKTYVASYGIRIDRAVEKDDIIDAIVAARGPNGCLPPANENFYRKYSVPRASSGRTRGVFSLAGQSSSDSPRLPPRPASLSSTYEFPRPDLEPDVPFRSYPGPPPPHVPRPPEQRDLPPLPPSPPRQSRPNPPSHLSRPDPPTPPFRSNQPYAHTPPLRHQHSHYDLPPQRPASGPSRASSGSRGYGQAYGQAYGGHVPPTPSYMTHLQQQPPAQSDNLSQYSPPRGTPYSTSPPPPRPPRPASVAPPPNLDQLVEMSTDSIGSLSISALKSILFTNHVTTGQILEKSDLVKKVLVLVENEKTERVRQRQMQEREEMERLQRAMETMHGTNHFERDMEEQTEQEQDEDENQQAFESRPDFDIPVHHNDDESGNNGGGHDETNHAHSSSTPSTSPPLPNATGSSFERQGMCVICQDEDANIAIIDCGHMAMCRGCSELVMASSKECPLCRTRIVTEARLLRIFRT